MSNARSPRKSIYLLFALGMMAMTGQAGTQSTSAASTTICQMMENPGAVSGQRVALRATIVRHSREEVVLASPTKCADPLRTKGFVWHAAIAYRLTGRKGTPAGWQQVEQRFQQLRPGEFLEATFTGIVSTKSREEYDAIRLENGMWVPANGFGHLGACFAELAIESVRDIAVVRKEEDSKE